jgi:hypothetical protein
MLLASLLSPCSGRPPRIPGWDGGVWGLSGVLHLFHDPPTLSFTFFATRATLSFTCYVAVSAASFTSPTA